MILGFAMVGALVAFVPSGSFVLIPMELFMIYRIADKHDAFEFPIFLIMGTAIVAISTVLKGLASLLHVLPVIGQIANSLVAFSFILALGSLAEKYYSGRRSRG